MFFFFLIGMLAKDTDLKFSYAIIILPVYAMEKVQEFF
jgi:hypothetical protein